MIILISMIISFAALFVLAWILIDIAIDTDSIILRSICLFGAIVCLFGAIMSGIVIGVEHGILKT